MLGLRLPPTKATRRFSASRRARYVLSVLELEFAESWPESGSRLYVRSDPESKDAVRE